MATPIKKTSLSNDHKNLDNIIQQNNYNNVYLKIIGENLQEVEDRITPSYTSLKKENDSKTHLFISYLRSPLKKFITYKTDNLLRL